MASYRSTAPVTAADRNQVALLNYATDSDKIGDLLSSCYIGSDGEPQHETRTDGSCRCGYRKPRAARH